MKIETTVQEITGEVWCDACTFPIEGQGVKVGQTVEWGGGERTEWFWFHPGCHYQLETGGEG
jgi:hypothetical protein